MPDQRIHALTGAGRIRIFAGGRSGENAEREEPRKDLDHFREGDTPAVLSLDRLGRSIRDLITIVSGLRKHGIGFTSLHKALDTTTPGGRPVFHVFAAFAEFIRELVVQGTHEDLDAAHPVASVSTAMAGEQIRHARDLLTERQAISMMRMAATVRPQRWWRYAAVSCRKRASTPPGSERLAG
ncbi:recombinase family protein [Streptomyces sp. NPDC059454]|uniref:recombinase family protein n=1 Tax=Streptomyces sp. NPDC059454 TaxID=3346836 RepID=UPI0036AD086C